VRALSNYTLGPNIENLFLEEGGPFTAGGNALANRLQGNSGNNVLAGGLGRDTLEGCEGDDVYVLSDELDTILDSGGNDTMRSPFDVSLQSGIENAELIGLQDSAAFGNAGANKLVGNMGSNLLDGASGVDTLTGGGGGDQFTVAYNGIGVAPDQITDFVSGEDLLVIDVASLGVSGLARQLSSSGELQEQSLVRGVGVRALDPDDFFILDTAQSVLKFDPDGSGPDNALTLVSFLGVVDSRFNAGDVYLAV
jgi:Ca2+-binding RTX toxin-like protein